MFFSLKFIFLSLARHLFWTSISIFIDVIVKWSCWQRTISSQWTDLVLINQITDFRLKFSNLVLVEFKWYDTESAIQMNKCILDQWKTKWPLKGHPLSEQSPLFRCTVSLMKIQLLTQQVIESSKVSSKLNYVDPTSIHQCEKSHWVEWQNMKIDDNNHKMFLSNESVIERR
jgi:hypothetical protein